MAATRKKKVDPRPPRERIVAAATAEFAEKGYEGARVDAIASRARTNKALLYYYVGNKEALYTEVLLENLARVALRVRSACEGAPTPAGRLRAYAEAFEGLAEERPHMPRLILRELASGGQHLSPRVLKAFLEVFSVIRGALEEGRERGEFRPVDPLAVHVLLVGGTMLLRSAAPLRLRAAGAAGLPLPAPGGPVSRLAADLVLTGLMLREPAAARAAAPSPEEIAP